MPPSIIDQIKEATDLAALITESGYTLTGRDGARTRTTKERESLTIYTDEQRWHWFSQTDGIIGGDVLDWYQRHNNVNLDEAIEALATRAGIERRPLTSAEQEERTQQQRHRAILRMAADHYHHQLLHHPAAQPARAYCATRAWSAETIAAEMIGCTLPLNSPSPSMGEDGRGSSPSGDNTALSLDKKLREANLLDHPTARAVLSIPPDMLVYTHRHGGQVVYLSGRSIEGKRHYNLPDTVGPKQPYHNSARHYGQSVLVEGQADAISLAQLGIPALAICGLGGSDLSGLANAITHIGLDADDKGHDRAINIAMQIGPMLPIVEWGRKDANALLVDGADQKLVLSKLETAKPALLHMASATRRLTGDLRTEAQRSVLDAFLGLDELVQADIKPKLADALGAGIAQLGRMIKARENEQADENPSDAKDNPDRYEHSAGGYIGGVLFEQCVRWLPDGSAMCIYTVRWPDGKIETRNTVDIGGVTYAPYPAHIGLINKEIVLFPEEATPYPDQRTLLRNIQTFIHKYLDVDPFYERLASYYVMFSWLFDLFNTLPYLRALGDYGTGKSRFLQTIGSICYRPMFMGGATTVSPIFRILNLIGGTLIIDEADLSNSDSDNEIIKIINLGYDKRQAFAFRNEKQGDNHWPEPYNVYGPKILATRKEFQDKATESRCLTNRMSAARPRPGIPYILDDTFWAEARALRNQLLTHRLRNHKPIPLDNSMAEESIEPRLNQVMMALKATIEDPAMREELTTFMIAYNRELIGKRGMQLPALVLQVVADIYYGPGDLYGEKDLSMQSIAERAQAIINEWDPSEKVSARRVTDVLNDDLGLTGREPITKGPHRGRKMLKTTDDDLNGLMLRWGVNPPEND